MKPKSKNPRVPVCECNDFSCLRPLGISWRQHRRLTNLGVLIARHCPTMALHLRDTYTVLSDHPTFQLVAWRIK